MLGWIFEESWGTQKMSEASGAYDGGAIGTRSGLMTDTRVATEIGWRKVAAISEGDLVLTFDSGLQRVTKVTRHKVWTGIGPCPRSFWPLHVPAGALGNRDALMILSHQYVMVESDAGEDLFGDPFSLIAAQALDGVNGIKRVLPEMGLETVVLHFENEQVVFAECGVLYYCPSARGLLEFVSDETRSGPPYTALNEEDAEVLVMCIEFDHGTARIWADAERNTPELMTA